MSLPHVDLVAGRWRLPPSRTLRRAAERVTADVREHDLWRAGATVGMAVSGGLDSLCGLRLLCALRRRLGHRLVALHVDHGVAATRAEALAVIQAACTDLAVPLTVAAVSVPLGADWEGRARAARYAALAQLAAGSDCTVIATAHHADDQAETLLLRLCRGAGPDALAGIWAARDDGVVRPLLSLTRAQLRELHGDLPWWTDPSNAELQPARNRIRHLALPALTAAEPDAVAGLCRSADALALTRGGAEAWLEAALEGAITRDGDALTVARDRVPADLGALALLLRWAAALVGAPPPTLAATQQFFALTRAPPGSQGLVRGMRVRVSAAQYRFEPG